MKQLFLFFILHSAFFIVSAQEYVVSGRVALPDGYVAGLVCHTDTAYSVDLGTAVIRDGQFELRGRVEQPCQGTLMTNNLDLIERNGWPIDSVRWTYTDVFLSPGELSVQTVGREADGVTPVFRLVGTPVQAEYNEWRYASSDESGDAAPWAFIDRHPQSVVSVWLANQLMERAYRLTADEVAHLEATVTGCPADTLRFADFQRRLAAAKLTVKDAPLTDLELRDTEGQPCHLTDIVAKASAGKSFVLIDFWASWCGICIHAMPEIARLADEYADRFAVVAVSIDTKEEAWHRAMEKHPEPWPQYVTTARGYQDLFDKYQVGNGVPYYLLVSADGRVIASPESPADIKEFLSNSL